MAKRLENKVALITGGSSGIGLATAILFVMEGASVAIASRSAEKGLNAVSQIKSTTGLEAMYLRADVSKSIEVKEMIQTIVDTFGRLDILFCNAGINRIHPILETTDEDWNEVISNNLTSVFFCCKYALPLMITQGSGSVICNASTHSLVGRERFGAYSASKGGILAFAKTMALEMAKYNIRVNCICPTTTVTPMVTEGWAKSGNPDKMREIRLGLHPIGRLGTPEDVAHAVPYLASDESSFITGSALVIDGGYTAQ